MSLRDKYTDEEWEKLELEAQLAMNPPNRWTTAAKKEEYQRVVIKQDDSGHDYVVPFEKSGGFYELLEDEELFEKTFGEYMCGGDPFYEYEFYIKTK